MAQKHLHCHFALSYVFRSQHILNHVCLERYLGICRPLWSPRKARFFLLPVLFFTLAFNAPRCLEKSFSQMTPNVTLAPDQPTSHVAYRVLYHFWASLIFLSVLPIVMLVFFNCSIVRKIYKASTGLGGLGIIHRKDPKATKTLLVIVSVFLVCHAPRILYKFLHHFFPEQRLLSLTIIPVWQLALIINSSVNFLIYCFVGGKFRKEFLNLFKSRQSTVEREPVSLIQSGSCDESGDITDDGRDSEDELAVAGEFFIAARREGLEGEDSQTTA